MIGYLKSSIVCLHCKSETAVKIDPFSNISLNISSANVNSIMDALV